MKLDKLNSVLMLIANAGVLIGIIALIFELQQTQVAMQAEASTTRALMAMEDQDITIETNFAEIQQKLRGGQSLTEEEEKGVRRRLGRQLRFFENLHYQWQLGVLDEEIWEANLAGISFQVSSPAFEYLYPDWPDGFSASIFRKSFVDLVVSYRHE